MIAEIGNNHNGSFELAQKLVDEAIWAGADCAKFQMRNLSLYRNQGVASDVKKDLDRNIHWIYSTGFNYHVTICSEF